MTSDLRGLPRADVLVRGERGRRRSVRPDVQLLEAGGGSRSDAVRRRPRSSCSRCSRVSAPWCSEASPSSQRHARPTSLLSSRRPPSRRRRGRPASRAAGARAPVEAEHRPRRLPGLARPTFSCRRQRRPRGDPRAWIRACACRLAALRVGRAALRQAGARGEVRGHRTRGLPLRARGAEGQRRGRAGSRRRASTERARASSRPAAETRLSYWSRRASSSDRISPARAMSARSLPSSFAR